MASLDEQKDAEGNVKTEMEADGYSDEGTDSQSKSMDNSLADVTVKQEKTSGYPDEQEIIQEKPADANQPISQSEGTDSQYKTKDSSQVDDTVKQEKDLGYPDEQGKSLEKPAES